jgi:hypothetical protein
MINELKLIIKRKYFDMILSGKKTEEYREIKKYYINKFVNKTYDKIILQAGYSKTADRLIANIESIKIQKKEFGLFSFEVFVIKLNNPVKLTTEKQL